MIFHQVDEHGAAWVDMAHIVHCLNKVITVWSLGVSFLKRVKFLWGDSFYECLCRQLDAGSQEKVLLMSRDEQNILVTSYAELKTCLDSSFNDIVQSTQVANF